MADTVLATKLHAPAGRPHLVARPRLLDRLETTLAAGNRLTLVSAPAGFGKTTLLTEWLARLDARGAQTRVAWVSLDPGDNDLARLLVHVGAALRGAGLDLDDTFPDRTPADALHALVNAVARAAEGESRGARPRTPERPQWILVLDDYHVVESPEVHESVTFLLDHLPDRLHLLVATRSDPPLALARLRTRGQLTEVRAADLRFTPTEAREFLNTVMGLELEAVHAAALEERTEGWAAGLQLAGLSLRGVPRDEVGDFIGAFTGSHRFVVDYLLDEVLARQPAEVREFLLRTAILDRLTGALCDAVTGRSTGARMLEDLERSNLFLVPLDSRRSWYRYHHLFADVLRARLLTEESDEVPSLHLRASRWYAAHEHVTDAVRHALCAEDFAGAARLMEEALPVLRRTRQDRLLLSWMHSLPEPVLQRSPVLSIASAWSLLMDGELDRMERRLDDAEAALAAASDDPDLAARWADTEDLRSAPATIPVYRASLAQARGDVAGTVRHARRALDLAGPADHFVRGAAGGFLGLAAFAAGDVHEGLSTFTEAVRSLHTAGNLVDELDSTVVLADMWVAAGRPGRARRLYDDALRGVVEAGEPYPRATADLHVGLAELDCELGAPASAEEHLETARVLGGRASITENRHRWFVAAARVRRAAGDLESARELLDRAITLYRPGFYPDLRPIAAMRARLQVTGGDLAPAAEWVQERGLGVNDDVDYLREYEHLTLVRLVLAQHRSDPAEGSPAPVAAIPEVVELLERMHAHAAAVGRHGSVLEILVLRALAHHARGEVGAALTALGQAVLDVPEPEGYVRIFLDEGPAMLDLLRVAATGNRVTEVSGQGGRSAALGDRARQLLRAAVPDGTDGPPQSLADPLTPREVEVLRLLATDLTGPEIARQLFVSLNTFRTHSKRIFTKLDVTTRAAAVRRGEGLGLLGQPSHHTGHIIW